MPKKFQGENSKSAVARARKEAVRQAEVEKKQKEEEDALWADDNKHVARKQQRKVDKEKKKNEAAERKAVSKQMLEEEMKTLKEIKVQASKMTRNQILLEQEKLENELKKSLDSSEIEIPLEENINHMVVEGLEARTVDEALSILSIKDAGGNVDHHPERRMKAAYMAFEEAHLPRLKSENPNLRLSQLKQMLKKDWMKSPENPLNPAHRMSTS